MELQGEGVSVNMGVRVLQNMGISLRNLIQNSGLYIITLSLLLLSQSDVVDPCK